MFHPQMENTVKRNKKTILTELNNVQPIITAYDIWMGFILLIGMVVIIFATMHYSETKSHWIQKDTNVREETIQHLHPNIP